MNREHPRGTPGSLRADAGPHIAAHRGAHHIVIACALACALAACGETTTEKPAEKKAGAGLSVSKENLKFLEIASAGEHESGGSALLPARIASRPQGLSSVGAPVAGRVAAILVRPGEVVQAGTVLARIQSADAAGARATLAQSAARLAAAEDSLRRNEQMMAKGVGIEMERIEAETRAREARAEHERARHASTLIGAGDGDLVSVRAPAGGIVTAIKAATGAMVAPGGEALVEIADPGRLWAVAELAESDAGLLKAGAKVNLGVPGVGRDLEGVVDGLGNQVSADTRRVMVYITLRGELRGLTPGMYAEVRLPLHRASAITLPVTAVLIKAGGKRFVYVQKTDGSFEAREVEIGATGGGQVAITTGLARGERTVVKGTLLLDNEAEQQL